MYFPLKFYIPFCFHFTFIISFINISTNEISMQFMNLYMLQLHAANYTFFPLWINDWNATFLIAFLAPYNYLRKIYYTFCTESINKNNWRFIKIPPAARTHTVKCMIVFNSFVLSNLIGKVIDGTSPEIYLSWTATVSTFASASCWFATTALMGVFNSQDVRFLSPEWVQDLSQVSRLDFVILSNELFNWTFPTCIHTTSVLIIQPPTMKFLNSMCFVVFVN